MPGMLLKVCAILAFPLIMWSCTGKTEGSTMLEQILHGKDDLVDDVLRKRQRFGAQIIYTQIDRDSLNNPTFISHTLGVDSARYFYPASTVKLPTALVALEKLRGLKISGLDKYSTMLTDSAWSGQTAVISDSTSENGLPSLAHYIRKILLVSDNDAYNRLYEFIGQQYLNESLKKKGYTHTRLVHRLEIFLSKEENQSTNPVRFISGDSVLYQQPLVISEVDYTYPDPIFLGTAHISKGNMIDGPMDFSAKNFMPLAEMHLLMRAFLFPETVQPYRRFDLSADDYDFVYKYMSMYPGESDFPSYDPETYYPSYVKFLMFGNEKQSIPENIRIFNKVGDAYGFLTDHAYVVDFENGVEFMVSAVLQVNENDTYNDGQYEYDEIGLPFLARIGRIIYDFELERERRYTPDFSRFQFNYDLQNAP